MTAAEFLDQEPSATSILDAPETGQEIAQLLQDPSFEPNDEQYAKYEEYSKQRHVDWVNTVAQALTGIVGTAGETIAAGAHGAAANPANYVEGILQGTRNLYGLAAQSQDPGSIMFRFKNMVMGDGSLPDRRKQFLEARKFAADSQSYDSGAKSYLPKESINPEFVAGLSKFADATLLLPGIGEALGVGKFATKAVGKAASAAGRATRAVLEPAGGVMRAVEESVGKGTLDAARGAVAGTTLAGVTSPALAAVAAAPLAVDAGIGLGKALETAGENLMTQPARIGPLEAIGRQAGASRIQQLVGTLGAHGGDFALDTGLRATAGALEGAAIGGALGYLSGGEQGAAEGVGAGLGMGALGVAGVRSLQKLTGSAAREARAGDWGRWLQTHDQPTRTLLEGLEARRGVDRASMFMDLHDMIKGVLGDIPVRMVNDAEYKARGGGSSRGITYEEGPQPAVLINLEHKGKGGDEVHTLAHEAFHAFDKTAELSEQSSAIKQAIAGGYWTDPQTGRVVQLSDGLLSAAEVQRRFDEYTSKLDQANQQKVRTQYTSPKDRADYVAAELGAEYFASLVSGSKPDSLLRGFGGTRSAILDGLMLQHASKSVARLSEKLSQMTGMTPMESLLFPDLKKQSPILDAMMRGLVRARRAIDGAVTIDNQPKVIIGPEHLHIPGVADMAVQLGHAKRDAQGKITWMSEAEVRQRDQNQHTAVADAVKSAPIDPTVPHATVDPQGNMRGVLSEKQMEAVNASNRVDSQIKAKLNAIHSSMRDGHSIWVNYGAATKRKRNTLTGRWSSKYSSSIAVSSREVLPYLHYDSKAGNPVIKTLDISKVRSALFERAGKDGSVGPYPTIKDAFTDFALYMTNMSRGGQGKATVEIFGHEKANWLHDVFNEAEKGGSRFLRDLRVDRIINSEPRDFRARLDELAVQRAKVRFMPAEPLGDGEVIKTDRGYQIIHNNGYRLYDRQAKLIGTWDNLEQAQNKVYALTSRTTDNEHHLGVDRQERTTIDSRNVKITPEEQTAVKIGVASAGALKDVNPSAIERMAVAQIRENKANHPVSDGWQPLVVDKVNIGQARDGSPVPKIEYKKIGYSFQYDPKTGRDLAATHDRRVTNLSKKLVAEIDKVVARAQQGDRQAQVILRQAGWYRNMTQRLTHETGGFADLFGDLLGAFSPNTDVPSNWRYAVEGLGKFLKGDYDKLLSEFDAYMKAGGSAVEWQKSMPVILKGNNAKFGMNSIHGMKAMVDIWRNIEAGQAPKARNFARNLIGQSLAATIDVWAARLLQRVAGEKRIPPMAEAAVQGQTIAKPTKHVTAGGAFGFGQEVFEQATHALKEKYPDTFGEMQPPDLQAVAWFLEKEHWAKNNWTSLQGEGGSFEAMADQQAMGRYTLGVSQERPEFKPNTAEQATVAVPLQKQIAMEPGVVGARVMDSVGYFMKTKERSFDVEVVADPSFDPGVLVKSIVDLQQSKNQDATFVSRVMDHGEENANARPGIEVYFKNKQSFARAQVSIKRILDAGFDGMTLVADPRTPSQDYPNKFIGVRLQYVPEFAGDANWQANVAPLTRKMLVLQNELHKVPGVARTAQLRYDTLVWERKDNERDSVSGKSVGAQRAELWAQRARDAAATRAARLRKVGTESAANISDGGAQAQRPSDAISAAATRAGVIGSAP